MKNDSRQKVRADPVSLSFNEGFRYRDLETGVFITRDPLGFVDGPNLYTYVRQNPWSKFDPEGLKTKDEYQEDIEKWEGQREEARADAERYGNRAYGGSTYKTEASRKIKELDGRIQGARESIGKLEESARAIQFVYSDFSDEQAAALDDTSDLYAWGSILADQLEKANWVVELIPGGAAGKGGIHLGKNAWEGARAWKASRAAQRATNLTRAESSVWRKMKAHRGDIKTSGRGKYKRYYQWDHRHNDIEVYDGRGRHLGSADPVTGEIYKPAVPGRRLDL